MSSNLFYAFLIISLLVTFSHAANLPDSLTGEPTFRYIAPGKCQFTSEFKSVSLIKRTAVSSTSSVLRFRLPDKNQPLNLSTCACLLARAKIEHDDGGMEEVVRPYTPISTNAVKGTFDLLVKNYGPPAKMSTHLHKIKRGDFVDFKHIDFNVKIQAPFLQKKMVMLAGGTGITPMIQALHAILGDPRAQNEVIMLYGSRVSDDILGRELLDSWAQKHDSRFRLIHILSDEPLDSPWKGLRGHMDKEILQRYLPPASLGDDVIVLVCGPPPMYTALCGPREENKVKGLLAKMGFRENQVYKF